MISTRGRYALRVLVDLARHADRGFVPLKEIAERQNISLKYLERILPLLKGAGIVQAAAGKRGGYKLASPNFTVLNILMLTESDIAPVACLRNNSDGCERAQCCSTLPMWKKFNSLCSDFFGSITLGDLAKDNSRDIL